MFERQKHLLALLDALSAPNGSALGSTDFQKLLWLYCQAIERPIYEFVPYKYGGFSFTSYADKRKLIAQGLLANTDHEWQLTELGHAAVKPMRVMRQQASQFAQRHAHLRGEALIAYTYRRCPWLATRSEIAIHVLHNDLISLNAIHQAKPTKNSPGIWTVGYEGLSVEAYLNKLLLNDISVLCDVRRNPLSRKYGFSKKELARNCERLGIRYHHLPELGIDSADRANLNSQSDYDALFALYKQRDLPHQTDALHIIQSWVLNGDRVALTCYELLPHQCHRHCVAEAVTQLFEQPIIPKNL